MSPFRFSVNDNGAGAAGYQNVEAQAKTLATLVTLATLATLATRATKFRTGELRTRKLPELFPNVSKLTEQTSSCCLEATKRCS